MNLTAQERSAPSAERSRIGLLMEEPIRMAGLLAVLETGPAIDAVPVNMAAAIEDRSLTLVLVCVLDSQDLFRSIRQMRGEREDLRIIAMSADSSEESIVRAISAGARGFLEDAASPEQLLQCIEVVTGGSIWAPRMALARVVDRALAERRESAARAAPRLTRREQEVVKLLAIARSNREIARRLGIEERTVKAHLAQLMRKVGVENRTALTMHLARRAHEGPTV